MYQEEPERQIDDSGMQFRRPIQKLSALLHLDPPLSLFRHSAVFTPYPTPPFSLACLSAASGNVTGPRRYTIERHSIGTRAKGRSEHPGRGAALANLHG